MRPLSKFQSRGLAVGLLILCLAVVALLLFVPVNMLHSHYDRALDSLTDYLGRYRRIIATRTEVESALDQVKKREGRKHFLKNTVAALAAAEIQETAKGLVEANGAKLISMQIVPYKDDGDYRRITINIQVYGSIPALRKILYSVETMQPYLLVGNVSLRSQAHSLYRGVAGVEPEMMMQFDLSGYALVAEGK